MTVYDKAEMQVHPVGYSLTWQPCYQFKVIALNLADPPSLLEHLVRKLKITVLASTPFYILGTTDSLTSTLKVPLSANIH